ncbi:MAG: hypothetical protein RJA67_92 [Bacteroidota bacterium]|jgi:hypothetical protein
MRNCISIIALVSLLMSCASIKEGESWKMRSKDRTIGLTLLWNLPESKLREMLPANQVPRIQNGKGVLMLFLCSTENYFVGKHSYNQLGIAHLIIPLKEAISLPETIGLKSQSIIKSLERKGFAVRFGDVQLQLKEVGDQVKVEGSIILDKGEMHFSGMAENKKGNLVSLEKTILVGKDEQKDILSGPEFYKPINFSTIEVIQQGENWIQQYALTTPPDRVWVNVDFGVDFTYFKKRELKQ